MTEADWRDALPHLMLNHIEGTAPASFRKYRLFALAYASFLESLPRYERSRKVVRLGEEVMEGRCSLDEALEYRVWEYDGDWALAHWVLIQDNDIQRTIRNNLGRDFVLLDDGDEDVAIRIASARGFILCVFGNPFRPVAFDPGWRMVATVGLAEAIYTDRAFDRLPILADALEEAGCDNADVLAHCRGGGPHARGCWVVDGVLGKM